MSYSYSYAYSYHSADEDIYDTKKSDDEGIIIPLPFSTHVQTNTENKSKVLVSTNNVTVDGNDTEIFSSSNINMVQNMTNDTVMVFPSAKVEASESISVESMSSLAKAVISVGVGCTVVLAMFSLKKFRRERFSMN